MTIETGLLILESILLVATIALLIFNLREGRGRKDLLLEVERATKVLTRQEYFLSVTDSMMDAKEEVIGCITGRPPAGEDKKRTRDIISGIEKLVRAGVKVKYLLPKFPDRLYTGYLYMKAGAEIRYSNCLMVHNVRFISVDNRIVVIGIPESIGEKEATKKGYRIPSEGLAMILKDYFHSCENQVGFIEYLKEVMAQTGATPRHLAQEFHIDEGELEKFAKSS
ncbi:MAG: hypothetical protein HY755_11860 [Nitrospirae bacterium]|nr:hypothetical protein [Nitrospirota bacterium]